MDSEKNFPGLDLPDRLKLEIDTGVRKVPAFVLSHEEQMSQFGLRASVGYYWAVQKGLSPIERQQVAYRIARDTSMLFENMQGSGVFARIPKTRNSSFSAEDLVSNLIGHRQHREPQHLGPFETAERT